MAGIIVIIGAFRKPTGKPFENPQDLRPFWYYSLYKQPCRVRWGEVALNCPEPWDTRLQGDCGAPGDDI